MSRTLIPKWQIWRVQLTSSSSTKTNSVDGVRCRETWGWASSQTLEPEVVDHSVGEDERKVEGERGGMLEAASTGSTSTASAPSSTPRTEQRSSAGAAWGIIIIEEDDIEGAETSSTFMLRGTRLVYLSDAPIAHGTYSHHNWSPKTWLVALSRRRQ